MGRALYLTALDDLATSNGHHGDVRKTFTARLNLDGRAWGLQNPPRPWINPGVLIILRKDALPTPVLLPLLCIIYFTQVPSSHNLRDSLTAQSKPQFGTSDINQILSRGGTGWGTSRALCLETREGGSNSTVYSEKRVRKYSHSPNRLGRVRESSVEKGGQRSLAEES